MQLVPCQSRSQIRLLFAMAGVLVLAASLLAVTVSHWWLLVAVFVAVNQLTFALIGACPASLIMRALCRRRGVTA